MDKQIAKFEEELSQPLESRASVGIAGEVRKFVRTCRPKNATSSFKKPSTLGT